MDIGIAGGKIEEPSKISNPEVIDLNGKIITPGLIDIHVHLRDPGQIEKETVKTGTMAAAAGGFTTIVAMPNTSPTIDSVEILEDLKKNIAENAYVNVLPSGCITKGMAGKTITDIACMKEKGIAAVTDDGKCVQNSRLMLDALEECKTLNIPLFDHCEDAALAEGTAAHDGHWAQAAGLVGMPKATETIMVARDAVIAGEINSSIHVQHISADTSVDAVREAQKKGIKITAEATPHHLSLTDECIKNADANYKMNPPLRAEEDRLAVIEGLRDGTISVIATDHAPHTEYEKSRGFAKAPFGIVGLETALPVCLTELYHKGILSLPELISKFTKGPAEVLNRKDIGIIRIGNSADLTVIDSEIEFKIDKNSFFSKSKNTPFHGRNVKGKVICTIVNGEIVYSEIDGLKGKI